MQTYTAERNRKAWTAFFSLLLGFLAIGCPLAALLGSRSPMRIALIPGMVLGALFGIIFLMVAHHLFRLLTVYEVDIESVTRRNPLGTRKIRWDQIVRLETQWLDGPVYILWPKDGKREVITPRLIGRDEATFSAVIWGRLAEVTARMQAEIDAGRTYHPGRRIGGFTLRVVVPMLLLGLPALGLMTSGSAAGRPLAVAFGLTIGLVLGVWGAVEWSRTLGISHERVRERSLTGDREIPWHTLEKADTMRFSTEGRIGEQLRLVGNGSVIGLSSGSPDYLLIREYCLAKPPGIPPEIRARAPRHSRRGVGLWLSVLLGAAGIALVSLGVPPLLDEWLVDTRGVRAQATVYKLLPGSREGIVEFTFLVPGSAVRGETQVPARFLEGLQLDQPIPIRYVPFNTFLSRAELGQPRPPLWEMVAGGAAATVAALLLFFLCLGRARQRAQGSA